MPGSRIYVSGFFILFLIGFILQAQALEVPLTITNRTPVQRIEEPVTSGVPLAESANIKDAQTLRIMDSSGNPVPAQFRVLSRWQGVPEDTSKPIRFVLIDFQADVAPNSQSVYFLRDGGTGDASGSGRIQITQTGSHLTVHTGAMEVLLRKDRFNLFDQVRIDTTGDGQLNHLLVTSSDDQGAVLREDGNSIEYRSVHDTPSKVEIELSGPMHSTILVKGSLKDEQGQKKLDYSARLHFYAGKNFLHCFFTLENNGRGISLDGSPDEFVDVRDFVLHTLLELEPDRTVTLEGYSETYNDDSVFHFFQDHQRISSNDELKNFSFRSSRNGNPVGSGGIRAIGYADLSDSRAGLTVAIRHFWQNFYKDYRVDGNALRIGLFPDMGTPHHFQGSYYKTHEILYSFHPGTFESSSGMDRVLAFNDPLFALAPTQYYADTKAFGYLAPDGLQVEIPRLQNALDDYEKLQLAKIDRRVVNNDGGTAFSDLWKRRDMRLGQISIAAGTRISADWYGWEHFGCIPWAKNYSGLHYDWPYGMTLQFVRSGHLGFMDLSTEMSRHSVDIDLLHSPRDIFRPGFWHYESDAHDNYPPGDWAARPSHSWGRGYVWQYWLTGDRRYYDSAILAGAAHRHWWTVRFPAPSNGTIEIRHQGWSMDLLIDLYRMTGDPSYLDVSQDIFTRCILWHEQQAGGKGYVNYFEGSSSNPTNFREAQPLMMAYAAEPILNYYLESGDVEARDLLVRMATWLKDEVYYGGVYRNNNTQYIPWQVPYFWDKEDSRYGTCILYSFFFSNVLAFAYDVTGDVQYLDFARKVFEDAVIYWDYYRTAVTIANNSSLFVSYKNNANIWLSIQDQMSKQHGWINRAPMYYLYLEYRLAREGGIIEDTTPLEISNVQAVNIQSDRVTISWQTQKEANSQVEYGLASDYGSFSPLQTLWRFNHSIELEGLSAGTLYHFRVRSTDRHGNSAVSTDGVFTTLIQAPDHVPPSLSDIHAEPQANNQMLINWLTDKPASSQVEYGLTSGYGNQSALDSRLMTSHSVLLTGLLPDTLYHYRVLSTDESGNLTVSENHTFTTPPEAADTVPPVIFNITLSDIRQDQARISWMTDEDATSYLLCDAQPDHLLDGQAQFQAASMHLQQHEVHLTGLESGTVYYYRIVATDASGNQSRSSGTPSFQTPSSSAETVTVVLQHGLNHYTGFHDFEIQGDFPDRHHEGENFHNANSNDIRGNYGRRPFLRFDLESIPVHAVVSSAVLTLNHFYVPAVMNASLHPVTLEIDYTAATRNTRDGVLPWTGGASGGGNLNDQDRDFLVPADATVQLVAPGFYSYDVTASVQKWVSGQQPNYGWLMLVSSGQTRIRTRRYSVAAERPKLIITYYVPEITLPLTPAVESYPALTSFNHITVTGSNCPYTQEILINGSTGGVTMLEDDCWKAEIDLTEGVNQIAVSARNATGQLSDPLFFTIVVDKTKPTAAVVTQEN